MLITIYAICKDEIKNVKDWLSNVSNADNIVVYDTGSTDGTLELLREEEKSNNKLKVLDTSDLPIGEFRFDKARNLVLSWIKSNIEHDWNITTDLDERLSLEWRGKLEEYLTHFESTEFSFKVIHTKNDPFPVTYQRTVGSHKNSSATWKYSAHEILESDNLFDIKNIEIHHYPEYSIKKRSYISLLKRDVSTYNDYRSNYYYGRELMYIENYGRAIEYFNKCLASDEVQNILYYDLANCYSKLNDIKLAENIHIRSCVRFPCVENIARLIEFYYHSDIENALDKACFAFMMLERKDQSSLSISNSYYSLCLINHILAVMFKQEGNDKAAKKHITQAMFCDGTKTVNLLNDFSYITGIDLSDTEKRSIA